MKTIEKSGSATGGKSKNDPLGLGVSGNGARGDARPPGESGRVYALRKDIRPDPGQPRKEFPEAAMEELRESIRANGVQDAVIVRTDPEGKVKWMLIEGERRWRVTGDLKIERLPIEVREMDEEQVRRYQRIVGTQRLNLSALEEARSLQEELERRRKEKADFSVADLAASTGRKRSSMYELLRLNSLGPVVRKALEEGKIDLSKAQLFGQVAPERHAELLKRVTYHGGEVESVKEIKQTIEREFARQLSSAPWKWDDAKLLPEAGACAACPKRSGNIEGLGGNPNICTDVGCFAKKQAANTARVLAEAKAQGKRIEDPVKYDRSSYNYCEPDRQCWQDDKRRSWGQLGKLAKVDPAVTVDREGKVIRVFLPEDKDVILKANKIRSSSNPANDEGRKKQKRRKENTPIAWAATDLILKALVGDKGVAEKAWRLIADGVAQLIGQDHEAQVAKRRGLAEKMGEVRDGLEGWLTSEKRTTRELQEFVVEALLCASWEDYNGNIGGDFKQLCKAAGVNLEKIKTTKKAK